MKPNINRLDARLVLLDSDNSGRDEMNLAGNPFALLQAASKSGQNVLRREYPRTLDNGRKVTAIWEVSGHPELGLPGPNEETLYLILLQLSREIREASESGEWPQTVNFSRHNLCERLGWSGNAREYKALNLAFNRLQAMRVQTVYSFHDPRTNAPSPGLSFNIIDEFRFVDEKKNRRESETPQSTFKWSDVVIESLRAGNVRSLALDFTLDLDTPTSKKLFRLLEVLRKAKKPAHQKVRLEIFALRDRIGMSNTGSYVYRSKVKEKIMPAINELIERGYLAAVDFEKSEDEEFAVFRFVRIDAATLASIPETTASAPQSPPERKARPSETKPDTSDIRADAVRCHEVFMSLDDNERAELLEIAKGDVSPIWHDRLGLPESPMSLGLWELVAARYPSRVGLKGRLPTN